MITVQVVFFHGSGKTVEAHFHEDSGHVEIFGTGSPRGVTSFSQDTPLRRFIHAQAMAWGMLTPEGVEDIYCHQPCKIIPRELIEAAAISKNPPTFEDAKPVSRFRRAKASFDPPTDNDA